jgi:hypothetical protein
VDVLLDELLTEEVNERNQIEAKLQGQHQQPNTEGDEEEEAPEERHQRVLDRKREVDLREIMRIFDDYKRIEESVANRLN